MTSSVYDQWGNPRYGLCSHGEANGFCDRGGCDEFWVHQQEAERERYAVKYATDKQVAFLRSLIRGREVKTTTPATDVSLAHYLRVKENVDPNSEWVFIPTGMGTICFYELQRFNEIINELVARLDSGEKVLMSDVSLWIKTYDRFPKKSASAKPKVSTEAPATTGNPATPKQKGFIKSLVAKRAVTPEIEGMLAQPTLTSKEASRAIALLLECPEKAS